MKDSRQRLWINVLSVILAILIWFIALSLGDPTVTRRITGIKVNLTNASSIERLNKTYSIRNETDSITINVSVRDRRSIVDSLKADDFIATADLSKWNELGNVPIVVGCKNSKVSPDSFIQSQYSLQLDIENQISKSYPIEPQTVGDVAVGYQIESVTTNPESVVVRAGQSVIDRIVKIEVTSNVTGMKKDVEIPSKLRAIDKNGVEIPGSRIEYVSLSGDKKSVETSIKILKTNMIPVKIVTTGELLEGLRIESIDVNPSLVEIRGRADKLAENKAIEIKDPVFNLSQIRESFSATVDIEKYLPNGIKLARTKDRYVDVSIGVNKLDSIMIDVPFDNIEAINAPKDLSYEIMGTGTAKIKIYGNKEKLLNLDTDNISYYIDLKNISEERTYKLKLYLNTSEQIEPSSDSYVYVRAYKVAEDPTRMDTDDNKDDEKNITNEEKGTENGQNDNLNKENNTDNNDPIFTE